jgi:hypothetical protein
MKWLPVQGDAPFTSWRTEFDDEKFQYCTLSNTRQRQKREGFAAPKINRWYPDFSGNQFSVTSSGSYRNMNASNIRIGVKFFYLFAVLSSVTLFHTQITMI